MKDQPALGNIVRSENEAWVELLEGGYPRGSKKRRVTRRDGRVTNQTGKRTGGMEFKWKREGARRNGFAQECGPLDEPESQKVPQRGKGAEGRLKGPTQTHQRDHFRSPTRGQRGGRGTESSRVKGGGTKIEGKGRVGVL